MYIDWLQVRRAWSNPSRKDPGLFVELGTEARVLHIPYSYTTHTATISSRISGATRHDSRLQHHISVLILLFYPLTASPFLSYFFHTPKSCTVPTSSVKRSPISRGKAYQSATPSQCPQQQPAQKSSNHEDPPRLSPQRPGPQTAPHTSDSWCKAGALGYTSCYGCASVW